MRKALIVAAALAAISTPALAADVVSIPHWCGTMELKSAAREQRPSVNCPLGADNFGKPLNGASIKYDDRDFTPPSDSPPVSSVAMTVVLGEIDYLQDEVRQLKNRLGRLEAR